MRTAPVTLVFDGDQTLWDFRSAMVRALGETRIEIARVTHVPLVSVPSIETMIATREAVAASAPPNTTLECLRRMAFTRTLRALTPAAGDEMVDRVTDFFLGRRYEMCRPYLETVPTLSALRESYGIALLTNGNSHPDKIGLSGLFDHVFFADDMGARKPDPAVYAHVAAATGSHRNISVGDSLQNDIVGAQRAGWQAVWINRSLEALPDGVRPDGELRTLEGLDVVVQRILG